MEPEVQNPGVSRTDSFWRSWERILFMPLPWLLVVAQGPWWSFAYRRFPPIPAPTFTWLLPVCVDDSCFLIGTPVMIDQGHSNPDGLPLAWFHLQRSYFQIGHVHRWEASQVALVVKNSPANAGDIRGTGLNPASGRSPGGRHGNPLQCYCLENPTDRGAWRATVCGVTKSWTQVKWLSTHTQVGESEVKAAQLCLALRPRGLYSPWNSPGQNTGVGSLSLL